MLFEYCILLALPLNFAMADFSIASFKSQYNKKKLKIQSLSRNVFFLYPLFFCFGGGVQD